MVHCHAQKPTSSTFVKTYWLPLLPGIHVSTQHRPMTREAFPPCASVTPDYPLFPTFRMLPTRRRRRPSTPELLHLQTQCNRLLSFKTLFNFYRQNYSHLPLCFSRFECLCTYHPNETEPCLEGLTSTRLPNSWCFTHKRHLRTCQMM